MVLGCRRRIRHRHTRCLQKVRDMSAFLIVVRLEGSHLRFAFKGVLGNPELGRKSWPRSHVHQLDLDDMLAKVARRKT